MSKYKEVLRYIQLYTGCSDHALKRIDAMLHEKIKDAPVEYVERMVYVARFERKQNKPLVDLSVWSEGFFQRSGLTYKEIAVKSRKEPIIKKRNKYVTEAYKEGYTLSEIARYLKKHHTTIYHCLYKIKTK